MQASNIPTKFVKPFGASATGSSITYPVPVTSPGTPGRSSLTTGFPPETFQAVESGGTPPWGADVNGVLFQATAWDQWFSAGGPIIYDSTFQTAIGGYPKGAVVQSATTFGTFWLCNTDNNTTNPDTSGAGWQNFFTTPTNITGNAGTATKLQTARSFTFTGDTTGGPTSFDGSANISIALTTTQAAKLKTARTIAIAGDATGSISFDGSANVSITVTLAASGVSAGTYNTVTVNSKGLITNGTNTAYLTAPVANASLANMAAKTFKGNNTSGSTTPLDLSVNQVLAALGFTGSAGSPGYLEIPIGSTTIIVQWGTETFGSPQAGGTFGPYSFPVNFPNSCDWMGFTGYYDGTPSHCENIPMDPRNATASQFTVQMVDVGGTNQGAGFNWLAIGH